MFQSALPKIQLIISLLDQTMKPIKNIVCYMLDRHEPRCLRAETYVHLKSNSKSSMRFLIQVKCLHNFKHLFNVVCYGAEDQLSRHVKCLRENLPDKLVKKQQTKMSRVCNNPTKRQTNGSVL